MTTVAERIGDIFVQRMCEDIERWKRLVERLVDDQPITWSTEGLDDGCFFCGADYQSTFEGGYHTFAHHWVDCPWVEATKALGRELGLNTVNELTEREQEELARKIWVYACDNNVSVDEAREEVKS